MMGNDNELHFWNSSHHINRMYTKKAYHVKTEANIIIIIIIIITTQAKIRELDAQISESYSHSNAWFE